MILAGFTIEATAPDNRQYYLVNGWYKHFALWIRKKDADTAPALNIPKIKFKSIASAKTSLTKLLKIMPDYTSDTFRICKIYEDGNETVIICADGITI